MHWRTSQTYWRAYTGWLWCGGSHEGEDQATTNGENAAANAEKIKMLEENLKASKEQASISVSNAEKTVVVNQAQYDSLY